MTLLSARRYTGISVNKKRLKIFLMKVHKIPLISAYAGQSTYIDYKYNVIKIKSVFTLMNMKKLKLSKLAIYSVYNKPN